MRERNLKLATVVACIIAAVGPPLGFMRYLDSHAIAGAERSLDGSAERMIARVDRMLGALTQDMRQLAAYGAETCEPQAREAMSQSLYDHHFLRRVRVQGPDGGARCDTSGAPWQGAILSSDRAGDTGTRLAVVMAQDTMERTLALVRRWEDGTELIAELAPPSLRFDNLPARWDGTVRARLDLLDGTAVSTVPDTGESDGDAATAGGDSIAVELASSRYPVRTSLEAARPAVLALHRPVKLFGLGAMGAFAVLSLTVAAGIARRRPELSDDIAHALEQGEFVPFYQPVIDLETGRLEGCEVLVRRRRSDGSIDTPASFIAQAESNGQIVPVTHHLMRQVIADVGDQYRMFPDLSVAFNLCAIHFHDDTVVRDVQDIFGGSPIRFRQLVFEVTERFPLLDMVKAKTVIAKLQAIGAKVALDDAGTGHSGLAALHRLGMDIVKIDKIFIDSIDADTSQAPIVDSLVELAKSLGMEVVAEGVETHDHVRYLRHKGVDTAQGYLFAPPLPAASYRSLVAAMRARRKSAAAARPAA